MSRKRRKAWITCDGRRVGGGRRGATVGAMTAGSDDWDTASSAARGATAASGADTSAGESFPTLSSELSSSNRIEIGQGVTLEAGPGGVLPVSLRWVVMPTDWPQAVAVDDDMVYVAADVLYAFRLSDGIEIWIAAAPDGEALGGSGEDEIGRQGVDVICSWSPYEYSMAVKRSTGHLIQFDRNWDGGRPPELEPFPAPEPQRFTFELGLEQIVARDQHGSVAWRITIDEPMTDELPPIEVPDGLLISTSSGHVLVLDYH